LVRRYKKAQAGDEYKYVIWNGEMKILKNDPYSKEVTNSAGNSIVVNPHFDWDDDDYKMPQWNELIMYQIHVGTFNSPQRNMPGTFKSVQKKLPYLKDLGINAIQFMPIMEFAGDYSWGYNIAYPFAVEETYGTSAELKSLINEAHKAGIAVILDVVYNHFGPEDLDLWRFDGWYDNDKGGIYFYNDWRSEPLGAIHDRIMVGTK
jgi:1,4-alpha-glucan branching enzyme